MNTAPLKALRRHPAQMRTVLDLEKLAALMLQVYERDLDGWQPIVAAAEGDGYLIVSGHRRHMARLLAFALDDWRKKQGKTDEPVTIETVRQMLKALVEEHGGLEAAAGALLATYGDREVDFALFEGDEKSQILALQAANFGSEEPDVMGAALSFRQALTAGVTVEQVARNAGVHARYVENHLALTEIPRTLAGRIAAGELPMSVPLPWPSCPNQSGVGWLMRLPDGVCNRSRSRSSRPATSAIAMGRAGEPKRRS